jgi:hypothetical protein
MEMTRIPQYAPMHPTQVREPFHWAGWAWEEKVDGFRMLAAPNCLEAWAQVPERSYEGMVGKDEASPYEAGRTKRWLKVKVPGWTDPKDRWPDAVTVLPRYGCLKTTPSPASQETDTDDPGYIESARGQHGTEDGPLSRGERVRQSGERDSQCVKRVSHHRNCRHAPNPLGLTQHPGSGREQRKPKHRNRHGKE